MGSLRITDTVKKSYELTNYITLYCHSPLTTTRAFTASPGGGVANSVSGLCEHEHTHPHRATGTQRSHRWIHLEVIHKICGALKK